MMKKQFHNIESLRAERIRLEGLCKEKEAVIGERINYLHEHFGSLVLTSLLPVSKEHKNKISGIIERISQFAGMLSGGEEGKKSILSVVLKIVQVAATGLVYRFVRRVFRRDKN
jgi:hypothetical protein